MRTSSRAHNHTFSTFDVTRLVRNDVIQLKVAVLQLSGRSGGQESVVAMSQPANFERSICRSQLIDEGLIWRDFRNRRQIGGLLVFAPTPYDTGDSVHEQGISRAGNERLQAISIQLAWNWVRWQPLSELTLWYRHRFADGGKRMRRIGIVAVARRLVIALWRYATTGVVPAGAIVKVA